MNPTWLRLAALIVFFGHAAFAESVRNVKGGPVMPHALVHAVFAGPAWRRSPELANEAAGLYSFLQSLAPSSYVTSALAQYGVGFALAGQKFSLPNAEFAPLTPPRVMREQVGNLIAAGIRAGTLAPPNPGASYMVFLPPGHRLKGAGGFHTAMQVGGMKIVFAVIVHQKPGTVPSNEHVMGHELVEMLSDPFLNAYREPGIQEGEIGDLCHKRMGWFQGHEIQPIWSQADERCVLPLDRGEVAWNGVHGYFYPRRLVGGYWQLLLGTPAPANIVESWGAALQAGTLTDEQIIATILGLPAFAALAGSTWTGWVTRIYQAILGRNPEPQGLQFWVRAVESGMPPVQVAYLIVTSEESQRKFLDDTYLAYLGRPGDAGGMAVYLPLLQSRRWKREQVVASLLGSTEFFLFHTAGARAVSGTSYPAASDEAWYVQFQSLVNGLSLTEYQVAQGVRALRLGGSFTAVPRR